jgi:hypothetical protein
MLRLFDKSYRKGDPNMMGVCAPSAAVKCAKIIVSIQHCAQTLLDFNGGASCVQIYVNQHDFFISKSQMADFSKLENSDM